MIIAVAMGFDNFDEDGDDVNAYALFIVYIVPIIYTIIYFCLTRKKKIGNYVIDDNVTNESAISFQKQEIEKLQKQIEDMKNKTEK